MYHRIFLAALALAALPASALAQSQTWSCEEGVRDLTGQLPAVMTRYQMTLNGDGTFYDQGVIHAVGMQYAYQAQGQWQASGDTFRKVGNSQDTLNGSRQVELNLVISSESRMHDTTQSGNTVFAAQCQRQQ